jgi:hypothetical protein
MVNGAGANVVLRVALDHETASNFKLDIMGEIMPAQAYEIEDNPFVVHVAISRLIAVLNGHHISCAIPLC